MPPTSAEYDEMELCRSWGGNWWGWQQQPAHERAALLAHEWEKNYREGYLREMLEKHTKDKDPGRGQSPAERVGASFFKGPPG